MATIVSTRCPPSAPHQGRRGPEPSGSCPRRAAQHPTDHLAGLAAPLAAPVVASAGAPPGEAVLDCTMVALLFVPVLLFTGFSPVTFAVAGLAVAATAYVLWARRVVVGESYVAVRQLGRYHVASVDHVRHLELKPTQRGGVLCLHTDDGRCMKVRRSELERPDVSRALTELCERYDGCTHDQQVAHLLGLPAEGDRIRHRYLPGVEHQAA
jgi:hypothetical protein